MDPHNSDIGYASKKTKGCTGAAREGAEADDDVYVGEGNRRVHGHDNSSEEVEAAVLQLHLDAS